MSEELRRGPVAPAAGQPAGADETRVADPPPFSGLVAAAPVAVGGVLLAVAATVDGAFAIRHWAPVGIFALVVLATLLLAGGGQRRLPVWAIVAAGSLWGLAALTALSALWSPAPGDAVEEGARVATYAALFALPLTLAVAPRAAAALAGTAIAVLGLAAVATLGALAISGTDLLLAGRLSEPVGYRNGTAALFGLAVPALICVAAGRELGALLRAGAFSAAVLSLGLAFLTQSRGVLVACVVGLAVVIALGPDRLRRAWLALLAAAFVTIAAGALLSPFRAFTDERIVAAADLDPAVGALAALALAALAAGMGIALLDRGLRITPRAARRLRAAGTAGLAGLTAVALAGALVAVGNPVSLAADKLEEFRTLDTEEPAVGAPRVGTVSGQRYDLWRIAARELGRAPVAGQGAGSYPVAYFRERQTDRNLRTPHSLGFQLAAEVGVLGLAALLGFLAALATGIARGWSGLPASRRLLAGALIGAGTVVLSQSMLDWLWSIPGLAGVGLFLLGLATAIIAGGQGVRPSAARPPLGVRLTGGVALVLAALALSSLFLSDFYVRSARSEPPAAVQARLDAARTAERLNPLALEPLYLQAGALEDMGRVGAARSALLEALDREKRNFVTYGLLGDLETRAGDTEAARRYYREALRLNPRDVGLQELAAMDEEEES